MPFNLKLYIVDVWLEEEQIIQFILVVKEVIYCTCQIIWGEAFVVFDVD